MGAQILKIALWNKGQIPVLGRSSWDAGTLGHPEGSGAEVRDGVFRGGRKALGYTSVVCTVLVYARPCLSPSAQKDDVKGPHHSF